MTKDVLVFVEQRDGAILPAGLQTISAAAELAEKMGGRVAAALVGHGIAALGDRLDACGVAITYVADSDALAEYNVLTYTRAMAQIVKQADPQVVLFAASAMGRDLSPRVAARLDAGLATDVSSVDLDENGVLVADAPIYNGKALNKIRFNANKMQMASVRPNAYAVDETREGKAERITVAFEPDGGDSRQATREIARTGGGEKDVTEAATVVAGGRSLKSEESFKIIADLAHALDGAIGASRAACDAGYQPHSRQVGLTGKTVTPNLYIACGVSGAIQHLAGMRGSRRIVAINTDPEAPIFKVADYGIVGDLFEVVPLLTEALQAAKAG